MERWRDRAAEAREMAEREINPDAKRLLTTIATCYDQVALVANRGIVVKRRGRH
jgi:hypothetical protein